METPRPSDTDRRNGSAERSTFDLLVSVADDTKLLLTKEIELARQEIVEALLAKVKAAGALIAAAVISVFVLIFGGLTAAAALDNVMPPWASRLVVTGLFVALAGGAALFGVAQLRKRGFMPEETKRTLKEEEAWARAQLQR